MWFLPSSSRPRSLPLLSMPEVCVLAWLVLEEECERSGRCGVCAGVRKLSVSMPDVCELLWLVVEWREKRFWCETLPMLLPLARDRCSSWSMSNSRASLIYDSRYCFFSTKHAHSLIFSIMKSITQNWISYLLWMSQLVVFSSSVILVYWHI